MPVSGEPNLARSRRLRTNCGRSRATGFLRHAGIVDGREQCAVGRRSGALEESARARAFELHDRAMYSGRSAVSAVRNCRWRSRRIQQDEQGGMVIYMSGHEGRGIGLWAKAATYLLQDAGEDTYEANRSLGLPDDSRDFSDAGSLLKYFLKDSPFRLLTNNPEKGQ